MLYDTSKPYPHIGTYIKYHLEGKADPVFQEIIQMGAYGQFIHLCKTRYQSITSLFLTGKKGFAH